MRRGYGGATERATARLWGRRSQHLSTRLARIVRLHHHPYGGIGARDEFRGEGLPIEARIVAACDRFDALLLGRPRSPAVGLSDALRELLRTSGRDLNPKVVAVVIEAVRTLQQKYGDVLEFLARDALDYNFTAARRKVRRAAGVGA